MNRVYVLYSLIPVTIEGTVCVAMGTVMEIGTHSIPVINPISHLVITSKNKNLKLNTRLPKWSCI